VYCISLVAIILWHYLRLYQSEANAYYFAKTATISRRETRLAPLCIHVGYIPHLSLRSPVMRRDCLRGPMAKATGADCCAAA